MTSEVTALLSRRWCVPESPWMQPLHGGLESAVAQADHSVASRLGDPRELVVKQLSGALAREADVYEALWDHLEHPPTVQMFGREVSEMHETSCVRLFE